MQDRYPANRATSPQRKRLFTALSAALLCPWSLDAIDLTDLDGTNGFAVEGGAANDELGRSVSAAGDINGDGIADLIIGAQGADSDIGMNVGKAFVVFGSRSSFPPTVDSLTLDNRSGVVITGSEATGYSGESVGAAGDINGDGFDDVIVGATVGAPEGAAWIVFGSDGLASEISLNSLNGATGFRVLGLQAGDSFGKSVTGLGDFNGDGIDDVIIGAPRAGPGGLASAGEAYIIFGNARGFPANLSLAALDGTSGLTIRGADAYGALGWSAGRAGDVNGDGIDDLVIGAWRASPDGKANAGASYVLFGSDQSFPAIVEVSNLNGGNGFTIPGMAENDRLGESVNGAGDVNGDGIDDLIIGASKASPEGQTLAGETYVVFGRNSGFSSRLELSTLDGGNGFRIKGPSALDNLGFSVSGGGDLNGDQIEDVIVGAPFSDALAGSDAGKLYVVFGRRDSFAADLDLSLLGPETGIVIEGLTNTDFLGSAVAVAGDVNSDGVDDLVAGAWRVNDAAGAGYVVFGVDRIYGDGFE